MHGFNSGGAACLWFCYTQPRCIPGGRGFALSQQLALARATELLALFSLLPDILKCNKRTNSCGAHASNFSPDLRAKLNFHRDYYIIIQASVSERNRRQNILAFGAWLIAEKTTRIKTCRKFLQPGRGWECQRFLCRTKKMSQRMIFYSVFFNFCSVNLSNCKLVQRWNRMTFALPVD